MKKTQGFTLIELLVVIGILSILAVALLIAINPAEAQRKARDTQRLKDMTNIQAAIEGWINDHPGINFNGQFVSSSGGVSNSRNCDTTGWMGSGGGTTYNYCNYLNRMPIDPRNVVGYAASGTSGSSMTAGLYYYVNATNGVYHICTHLESLSNGQKLLDDGVTSAGTGEVYFDVYSSTSIGCPN